MEVSALFDAGKAPRDLFPWVDPKNSFINAAVRGGSAVLHEFCLAGMHNTFDGPDGREYGGYPIMDDTDKELSRHVGAAQEAHGRVLKTGLGLGCFVRMALINPNVRHIDVIEINPSIISHFGKEFRNNPKVTLHCGDALVFPLNGRYWDFVWHDIYTEGNKGLEDAHTALLNRYAPHCSHQGAWALPRFIKGVGVKNTWCVND